MKKITAKSLTFTKVISLLVLLSVVRLSAEDLFKAKQSQINGLLIVKLDDGSTAGKAAQMNATLITENSDAPFKISFNQSVGDMMSGATAEVAKYIGVKHNTQKWNGHHIELAFSNKYSSKDGPSAAVVCSLMVRSLILGNKIDPHFAATGDMTAAGDVRPVGGVDTKIGAAIRKKCKIVGIPKDNSWAVSDLYLLKGIKPLYEIQIFSLETFNDAEKIAYLERPEDYKKAIAEFDLIQKALRRNEKFIHNKQVKAKLRAIVKLAPNHISARTLYLHAVKKGPKKLSLFGSLNGLGAAGQELGQIIKDRSFKTTGGHEDVLTKFISEHSKLRPMLDDRTKPYSQSYIKLASFIKEVRNDKTWSRGKINDLDALFNKVKSERKKLHNNAEVQEELMLE